MSSDELLQHVDDKLESVSRLVALLRWLAVVAFGLGVWATMQQMTIASLIEWKTEKNKIDERQDSSIHLLEKDMVLTKAKGSHVTQKPAAPVANN